MRTCCCLLSALLKLAEYGIMLVLDQALTLPRSRFRTLTRCCPRACRLQLQQASDARIKSGSLQPSTTTPFHAYCINKGLP